MPYVAVSVPQDFVQYVAELPAEDGAAVQREAQRVGPEGVGSLLPVSPQDDSCCSVVKEAQTGGVPVEPHEQNEGYARGGSASFH